MSPELLASLYGLIGVFVGGIISIGSHFFFLRREEKRIASMNVVSLMLVLKSIADDVFSLSQTIRRALPEQPRGLLSDHLPGIANLTIKEKTFVIRELASLRGAKADSVREFLMLTEERHRSIYSLFIAYSALRSEHQAKFAQLVRVDTRSMYQRATFNADENPELVLEMMQLNNIAFELVDMLNEFFQGLADKSSDFIETLRASSGSSKLEFKLPDQELTINVEGYLKDVSDLAVRR